MHMEGTPHQLWLPQLTLGLDQGWVGRAVQPYNHIGLTGFSTYLL